MKGPCVQGLVLGVRDGVFGSVNANRRHHETAADVLANEDPAWPHRLIMRCVPLERLSEGLERRPDG